MDHHNPIVPFSFLRSRTPRIADPAFPIPGTRLHIMPALPPSRPDGRMGISMYLLGAPKLRFAA